MVAKKRLRLCRTALRCIDAATLRAILSICHGNVALNLTAVLVVAMTVYEQRSLCWISG